MTTNLIATVGSNPLPVLLVARHLKPPKLWLLYTKSTQGFREQIERLLRPGSTYTSETRVEPIPVEMSERLSLHEAIEELQQKPIEWKGAHLNYTAGTKQMSVVAHQVWRAVCITDGTPSPTSTYWSWPPSSVARPSPLEVLLAGLIKPLLEPPRFFRRALAQPSRNFSSLLSSLVSEARLSAPIPGTQNHPILAFQRTLRDFPLSHPSEARQTHS